jgi:hypothetical protein
LPNPLQPAAGSPAASFTDCTLWGFTLERGKDGMTAAADQWCVMTDVSKTTERDGPCRIGGSQKTATEPSSPCMSATTLRTNTRMGGCALCLQDQGRKSSCEPETAMPDLFGEVLYVTGASRASIAPFSAMKDRSYRLSLSDRLTPLLIKSGLVAGITPTSIRRQFGAAIPDTVFWSRDGRNVE